MKLNKGKYAIVSRNTNLVLGIENSSKENGAFIKLQLIADQPAENQQWEIIPDDKDDYKIVNVNSGKALDLCMLGTENGTWIHQWEAVPTDSQLWEFEDAGDGHVLIRSKHAGSYLDIHIGTPVPNAQLQIWEKTGSPVQEWHLSPLDNLEEKPKTKKAVAKKATAKKAAPKKAPAKKAAPKKAPAKKTTAKAETAKATKTKAETTKTAAKTAEQKAPAKKTTTKKAAVKKTTKTEK